MIKLILQVLVVMISYTAVLGQSNFRAGYIVTSTGDTVRGFINYSESNIRFTVCKFKSTLNGATKEFYPSDINVYQLTDYVMFESKNIELDTDTIRVFLEVLVKGRASLFKYHKDYYLEYDTSFYLLDQTEKEVIVNDQKYLNVRKDFQNILSNAFKDCQSIADDITKTELKEKSLTNLVLEYNKCSGEAFSVPKGEKRWFLTHFGVGVAWTSSRIDFQSNSDSFRHLTMTFDQENYLSGGIDLELEWPRISERLTMYLGLYYANARYTSDFVVDNSISSSGIETSSVNIELALLKIPWAFTYAIVTNKVKPYARIGLVPTFHLSSSSNWIKEIQRITTVEIEERNALDIRNTQLGYFGGLGIRSKVSTRFDGYFEVRYESSNGIDQAVRNLSSRINNVQLILGVIFK